MDRRYNRSGGEKFVKIDISGKDTKRPMFRSGLKRAEDEEEKNSLKILDEIQRMAT